MSVFASLQRAAKELTLKDRPTTVQELLTRHGLESFVHRLSSTHHAACFVMKGGLMLDAYGLRRPTKDVDSVVSGMNLNEDAIRRVIEDVAAVKTDDGLDFDSASVSFVDIREGAQYSGMRVRIAAALEGRPVSIAWDISTGDPIAPEPRLVLLPRTLGAEMEVRGYAPETIVAEKGVTILERGITSTRWRDYVDIVQLAALCDINAGELERACRVVAEHRGVELTPIAPVVEGYGLVGQKKWAAWRTKNGLERLCEPHLDSQMLKVSRVLDAPFQAPRPWRST